MCKVGKLIFLTEIGTNKGIFFNTFAAAEGFLNVIYFTQVLYKCSQACEVCRNLVCQEVLAILHYSQLLNHICIPVDLVSVLMSCAGIYILYSMESENPFLKG